MKFRLENEYNVDIIMENLPYEYVRWVENKDIDMDTIVGTSDMKKVMDLKGRPLLLFVSVLLISLNYVKDGTHL